jgi:hypothetical protein
MIRSRREGFALATTILALLVVGAIVTGGFYAASQEGQVARASGAAEDALFVAETGMNTTISAATLANLQTIPLNTSVTRPAVNVTVGTTVVGNYTMNISRVADKLYLFRSRAIVTKGGRYAGATHVVSNMIRVRNANFDTEAAIQVYGNLVVGGNADVDGDDMFPLQWAGAGCPPLDASTDAVNANPGASVTTQGSGTITGTVDQSTPLDTANFTVFGDVTWADLIAVKDKTYANGATVGPVPVWTTLPPVCKTSVLDNWGHPQDPTNPCFNYFPIIYAEGDMHISSGGFGQGILLVEGDLEIQGGFNFYGVVVVLGRIRIQGTGGHVFGTTLAYGEGDVSTTNATFGNAELRYSSCAIERAMLNSPLARAVPIRHRSWMDISAIAGGN